MAVPKVFVSYSHDSVVHKRWVLHLATRLRTAGVDATIDQWDLKPGDDIPHYMETHLSGADKVLMVCTSRYVEKANLGTGGVGYEKMIVTSELLASIDSNKVIPVLRNNNARALPTFLKTRLFIDLSSDDGFETGVDELLRALLDAPLFVKPEIGENPFESMNELQPVPTSDPFGDFLNALVSHYEAGGDWVEAQEIARDSGMSRIMVEVQKNAALERGLVDENEYGVFCLSDAGKLYVVQNGFVDT